LARPLQHFAVWKAKDAVEGLVLGVSNPTNEFAKRVGANTRSSAEGQYDANRYFRQY
jgi:hypothetical protein